MIKIVGIKESKGTFVKDGTNEKVNYDNVILAFVTNDNPDYEGYATELYGLNNIKIPRNKFAEITGMTNPADLYDKEIAIDWLPNKYGKLVIHRIKIVK